MTIYMWSKNNIKVDQQLLSESEPTEYSIENNLLNTVDDENNFNLATENSNFH